MNREAHVQAVHAGARVDVRTSLVPLALQSRVDKYIARVRQDAWRQADLIANSLAPLFAHHGTHHGDQPGDGGVPEVWAGKTQGLTLEGLQGLQSKTTGPVMLHLILFHQVFPKVYHQGYDPKPDLDAGNSQVSCPYASACTYTLARRCD